MTASDKTEEHVKVRFALEQDEDGWPPVGSEGCWAVPLGGDKYRIDNIPWFVRDLACEDEVIAKADQDGVIWAAGRARWGGHLTIRVIVFEDSPLKGDLQAVLDAFIPLGVDCEGIQQYRMVALDVPPDADLAPIKKLLVEGEANGSWAFEEGCINDTWRAL